MRAFAALYAALDATTATRGKLAALREYFSSAEDADAAWALYFLAGARPRQVVPTRVLRELAREASGVPEWLFEESYQAVGDLAETIAHLLPEPGAGSDAPLARWIEQRLLPLRGAPDAALRARLRAAWRELDTLGRFVWNKLITGGFRVGVSRALVTRAIAEAAGLDPQAVAERLMGEWQPSASHYRALLAPAGGEARLGRPYPFFLAHPLQQPLESLGPVAHWHAEWKWDGIRGQLVCRGGAVFLWTRGEELVTERFPEIAALGAVLPPGTVMDGEILAWRDGAPLPFAVLQQRIGRKQLGPKVLAQAPVALVAYDLLEADGEDLRPRPFHERRARLEALVMQAGQPALVLSPVVTGHSWDALIALREGSRARGVEGLMLKRRESAYGAGRVKLGPGGEWWKWKIDPLSVDAVLVYAQRGHGRRASLYTDYTFAVWNDGVLVPFAKAYSGLSDAEIQQVDAFIRANTLEKFGPVRSVRAQLVMELGFEGIQRSARHKSGVAVRFPRMLRIRADKPATEADSLAHLHQLLHSGDPAP
ncbi:MAG: ATP-dependent DNA ligase [Betaproteobacteria bacterium]